LAAVKR